MRNDHTPCEREMQIFRGLSCNRSIDLNALCSNSNKNGQPVLFLMRCNPAKPVISLRNWRRKKTHTHKPKLIITSRQKLWHIKIGLHTLSQRLVVAQKKGNELQTCNQQGFTITVTNINLNKTKCKYLQHEFS